MRSEMKSKKVKIGMSDAEMEVNIVKYRKFMHNLGRLMKRLRMTQSEALSCIAALYDIEIYDEEGNPYDSAGT